MLSAVVAVSSVILLINDEKSDDLARLWLTAMIGIPFFTALVVFGEDRQWNITRKAIGHAIGFLLLGTIWYFLDLKGPAAEYKMMPVYVSTLLVAHLLVAIAPFLNQRPVRDFWEYNKQIFANFIIGAAFTYILMMGLGLAILAVDRLFDLNLDGRIYIRLFAVLAGIFNTAYFLYHFPNTYSFEKEQFSYNFLFKTLCKFILIPIVGLYFVILYAYSLKILITWNLPHGWVGSLVIGFSVAGIFTYLLNFYLPEQDDSWLVAAYRKWLWWIMLPMTALLFVAIGRRVSDYGVTEPRYLVIQLGVWLLLNCLYFLLSRKDNIKIIPISLAIFTLAWAYGPFSASAVSERSQLSRVKTILGNNGRFENGQFKPGAALLTEPEYNNLQSALDFFERREAMEVIDHYLPTSVKNLPDKEGLYGDAAKLLNWLGIQPPAGSPDDVTTLYINTDLVPDNFDIKGFTRFYPVSLNKVELSEAPDHACFILDKSGEYLVWLESDKGKLAKPDSLDLRPQIKKWLDMKPQGSNLSLEPEQASFDIVKQKTVFRIALQNATLQKDKTGSSVEYLNGYVLVKDK